MVAVDDVDGSPHQHYPLQLAECCRVAIDRCTDVGERSEGEEGDLSRVAVDLFKKKGDGVTVGSRDSFLCPGRLRERCAGLGWDTDLDGDAGSSCLAHHAIQHSATHGSIAPGRRDAENVQLWADERQVDGEHGVDVSPNIGVDYDARGCD